MYQTMRTALLGVVCLAVVVFPFTLSFSAEDDLSGFTLRQLDSALVGAGLANQKLYSILTFDSEDRRGANIAVLSGSRSGWQVVVLHRVTGRLDVQWRSGKLADDFDNSDSINLLIESIAEGDEQVVEFSGCATHQCGGLDGVFGVLLYSPRTKQVFFAHYRYDDKKPLGSFGSLVFSRNADEPKNKPYKNALQRAMDKIIHR